MMDSSPYDLTALRGFCVIFSIALLVWPIITSRYLLPFLQEKMEKSLDLQITKGSLGFWDVTKPEDVSLLTRMIVMLNQISVILIPLILILACSVFFFAEALSSLSR